MHGSCIRSLFCAPDPGACGWHLSGVRGLRPGTGLPGVRNHLPADLRLMRTKVARLRDWFGRVLPFAGKGTQSQAGKKSRLLMKKFCASIQGVTCYSCAGVLLSQQLYACVYMFVYGMAWHGWHVCEHAYMHVCMYACMYAIVL